MFKIVKPHRMICSRTKFLKLSNPQNDSKELPNLEHSPCLHPTMWFINIITFHFLIAFRDLIWRCSKGWSKFDYMSLMILILPNQRDFLLWFAKMVVQRITSCSYKKKKIILFQNPVLLNYVLTWSSMKEVCRQPFKGPVPITQITLENKFKTMWQNCLGAC